MSRKVLHLQKATGFAGSESFLVRLGRGLTDRGWNCRIAVLEERGNPVDPFEQSLREAGWRVDTITMDHPLTVSALRRFRGLVRDFDPDLVNTHLIHGDLLGALATLGLDVPVVSTKHNDDRFKHRFGYWFFAQVLNQKFDHVVAISDHLVDFYRNDLGLTNKPFTRIYYGLDPEEFVPPESTESPERPTDTNRDSTLTLGMVARLTEQKGHRDLIDAFDEFRRSEPGAELVLVGDGPLRGSLEERVADLGLSNSVHFLGYRSDVPALLKEFDVFVHPSRWEGFGLVFLEAMAAKLPVVASRVSAIPEIVLDGETGFLVEPGDVEALTRAMRTLAEEPELRRSMGRSGRNRLETTFGVARMIDQYDELYRSIIERSRPKDCVKSSS